MTDGLVNVTVGDITVQDIPVRILTNSINGNTVQIPVAANVNAVVAAAGQCGRPRAAVRSSELRQNGYGCLPPAREAGTCLTW